MRLPFTLEQFLDLFRQYNDGVGVTPLALTALAAAIALLANSAYPWRHRAIAGGLATLWLWAGVVYQWVYFTRINAAAWVFGAAFVAQGFMIAYHGVGRDRLRFAPRRNGASVAGLVLMLYALFAYPAFGRALGHGYPGGPSFGTPCPTTIFFFGMMLWAIDTVPVTVLLLPLAWTVVGTSAALQLGIREDLGLAVAAVTVLVALALRRRPRVHAFHPPLGA